MLGRKRLAASSLRLSLGGQQTAAPPPSRGRRPFTRAAVSRPAYDRTASELPSREAAIMQGIKLLDQRILVRSTQTNPLKEQIT